MPRKPRTDGKPKGTRRMDKKSVDRKEVPADIAHAVPRGPWNGGRPIIELNEDLLYEIAKSHASFDELARIFGVSNSFLAGHVTYRPIIDKARSDACVRLRSAQLRAAIEDRNPTMQIWMGKQLLEQKDVSRTEHTGPDGKPIATDNTTRAVAYIPENHRDDPPATTALPASTT